MLHIHISSGFPDSKFIFNIPLLYSLSIFMSYVHISVNNKSQEYRENDRRHNYTTPKSFLEQIKLYENLLKSKRVELLAKMERLENGLQKLQSTAAQVDDLKAKLASQEVELKQKNEDADKLIAFLIIESTEGLIRRCLKYTRALFGPKVQHLW